MCEVCSMQSTADGNAISENFTSWFDVYHLTNVGLDTMVELTNLSLDQGASYTAVVLAIDESGTCMTIKEGFVVDITPPNQGQLGVGPDFDLVRVL